METAQKRETDLDVLPLRETSEQRSEKAWGAREVVLGMLFKLLVKDKLLHSGKVPVNTELTGNGSSAIRHFEGGDEDVTE